MTFPDREAAERAAVESSPTDGRKPEVDVQFFVPPGAQLNVSAELWAWEDFRFSISVKYPAEDRSTAARSAIASLARAGFVNWKNRWLWRSLPLEALLERPDLTDRLLAWARESFGAIAMSEILALPTSASAEDGLGAEEREF